MTQSRTARPTQLRDHKPSAFGASGQALASETRNLANPTKGVELKVSSLRRLSDAGAHANPPIPRSARRLRRAAGRFYPICSIFPTVSPLNWADTTGILCQGYCVA